MLNKYKLLITISMFFLSLNLIGCHSSPKAELAQAEAALAEAKAEGAENSIKYKQAESYITRAKKLMKSTRKAEARKLLEEAKVNAYEAMNPSNQ
ncbi:MAG: hypothetical protein ACRENO_07315 [Thermodesulfobacteriota bacterium]